MPPVNPTGKTWELVNEGDAKGSTDNVIGGGGGPSDPSTLPLINGWDESVFTLGGGFRLGDGQGINLQYDEVTPIAISSESGKLWGLTESKTTTHDVDVFKATIPALLTDSDALNLNLASIDSGRFDIATDSETGIRVTGNNSKPRFVYEYNNKLIVINHHEYWNSGFKDIVLILDDSSDYLNSNVTGYIDVEGEWLAMGWISEVPTEWQQTLGYSHFCGASHVMSRDGRSSLGPSFYGINLDTLVNATTSDTVATERFMSYPLIGGESEEGSIIRATYPGLGYNRFNADAYEGPSQGNDIFTHSTRINGGFIIPGTRTYMCIGGSAGMGNAPITGADTWVVYENGGTQITLDGGTKPASGNHSTHAYDNYPFYMMFDLNTLMEVKNGTRQYNNVPPYAWGRIPDSYFPYFVPSVATRDDVNRQISRVGPTSIIDSSNDRILVCQPQSYHSGSKSTPHFPAVFEINYDVSGL